MTRDRSASHLNKRVSNVDRDRVVEHLREAAGEGRITLDELGERIDQASAAVTFSDLDAVTADLPGQHVSQAVSGEVIPPDGVQGGTGLRFTYRRSLGYITLRWTAISGGCVLGYELSGSRGEFWPVYVILFSVFRIVSVALRRREARRRLELIARDPRNPTALGFGNLFGPNGPFGRSGPLGPPR